MSKEEILTLEANVTSHGWEFKSQCSCGGTLRRKFTSRSRPGVTLVLSPHRGNYHFEENGSSTGVKPISNLEKEIS